MTDAPSEFDAPPRHIGYLGADAGASLDLSIKAKREKLVRAGAVLPINETEARQAAEGPRADADLDCARRPTQEHAQ